MGKFKIYAFLSMCAVLLILSGPANAADAVRVYLELTDNTATVWPTSQGKDYLRARAVLLDANNEMATTFAGLPISDAQLVLESSNYGSGVLFSTQPATDLDLTDTDWKTAAASVLIELTVAWQEFAVSYDNIDEVGDDIIVATLKQGATIVAAQVEITVEPPLANCWIARTGGISSLPGVLDEIPGQKSDGGRIKRSGDATTVDVFTAFYNENDEKYYFTNNVPEDIREMKIGADNDTLEDGHAQHEVTKKSKSTITESVNLIDYFESDSVMVRPFSPPDLPALTRWVGDQSGDVTDEELLNITGSSIFFDTKGDGDYKEDSSRYQPDRINKITIVGLPVNEITSSGEHRESGFNAQDQPPGTAKISPYDAFKLLKDPTQKPAPSFRVPGKADETYIYGAIVGFDESNKPVPFAENSKVTFYLKRQGGVSINSTKTELEALSDYADAPFDGIAITTKYKYQSFMPFKIKAAAATADGSIASITSLYISDIIIDEAGTPTHMASSLYENIDEETEGIDFIAQDTIESIDLTDISSLDGGEAGDDAEVILEGKGAEREFNLRVVPKSGSTVKVGSKDGASAKLFAVSARVASSAQESTDTDDTDDSGETTVGSSEVVIPNDKDNVAREDVVFYTALDKKNLFFVFEGLDEDTNVVQYYPDTSDGISISAAGGNNQDPSSISSDFLVINVNLDDEEKHNKVLLNSIVTAKDAFGNKYNAENTILEDSDIKVNVYLPVVDTSNRLYNGSGNIISASNGDKFAVVARVASSAQESSETESSGVSSGAGTLDTATASDTEFPGASVKIDDDNVEISFSLDEISDDQDLAVVKFVTSSAVAVRVASYAQESTDTEDDDGSSGGTNTLEITMNLRKVDHVSLNNIFVPVPGVTDTPVELFLSAQNSSKISPVATQEAGATGIEVELGSDNGSLSSSVSGKVSLKAETPRKVFTAKPDAGKTSMSINASSSSYGETTLELIFVPDFDPPFVGEIKSGNCISVIEVTDNQAVDLSKTEVSVLDSEGNDITGTLTRTDSEDGASGTILLGDFPEGDGDYTLLIIARDKWNNENEVTRSVAVSCESQSAECLIVEPEYGVSGETFTVSIQGDGSAFVEGITDVSFGCQEVTVEEVTVKSSTELEVVVSIGSTASAPTAAAAMTVRVASLSQEGTPAEGNGDFKEETCDIVVTTGSEVMVCDEGFEVFSETPVQPKCMSVVPSSGSVGTEQMDVTIEFGTTVSRSDLVDISFECTGITVLDAVLTNNNTSIVVTISISDDASDCTGDVIVNFADKEIVCSDAFSVGTGTRCSLTGINPQLVNAGTLFPSFRFVTISGNNINYNRNSKVEFEGSEINVLFAFSSSNGTKLRAFIMITPGVEPGEYPVTVTTDGVECSGVSLMIE